MAKDDTAAARAATKRTSAKTAAAKTVAAKKVAASGSRPPAPARRTVRGNGVHLDGGRARDREVIDTAVQIFWEKGYSNASVQDVADALGMLKGSLYYYIDSKEGLLRKIFHDSHWEITAFVEAADKADGTAAERLSLLLRSYATWTLTHLERAGLYSREWRYAGEALRETLLEQQRYYVRHVRALITAGQDEGALDPAIDARLASLFILAALTGMPDWFRADRDKLTDVVDAYVDLARRVAGDIRT